MNRPIHTDAAPPSFSDYSQAVEVPAGARMLHVSGQVGNTVDRHLPEDAKAQAENAWANVFAILKATGMEKTDIVDVLVLLNAPEAVPAFREVRDRVLEGHLACSTMMICGLADPDWKVEIAVRAARAD